MDDLIYNQRAIPRSKWRYGLRSSAATGCGWVATYNCLRLLGKQVNIPALIAGFERQLPGIHGNFGTFVLGPALLLRRLGFRVTVTLRRSHFDRVCRECDGAILFYYWRRGLRIGSHFVAVQAREDGFVGYNTYANSAGPDAYGQSLETFLRKQGYFCAVLTGVRK